MANSNQRYNDDDYEDYDDGQYQQGNSQQSAYQHYQQTDVLSGTQMLCPNVTVTGDFGFGGGFDGF